MDEGRRDIATGRMTTGHEWNGIEELDTPVPKVVLLFLGITAVAMAAMLLLYPGLPLGWTYTKGLLGIDQQQQVADDVKEAAAARAGWEQKVETMSFAEIEADAGLMANVRETGRTLFQDNCAACHGANATGGPGYPNLASKTWLWGGDIDSIAETIRVGINSTHADTRVSQMLAFGKDGVLQRQQVNDVVAYVRSLTGASATTEQVRAGQEVFLANCASCHGENAKGMADTGAPDLTDGFWIYGGGPNSVFTSVWAGRQGLMPHWEGKLTPVARKMLALYVTTLEPAHD